VAPSIFRVCGFAVDTTKLTPNRVHTRCAQAMRHMNSWLTLETTPRPAARPFLGFERSGGGLTRHLDSLKGDLQTGPQRSGGSRGRSRHQGRRPFPDPLLNVLDHCISSVLENCVANSVAASPMLMVSTRETHLGLGRLAEPTTAPNRPSRWGQAGRVPFGH
jgi:hypothetical protein